MNRHTTNRPKATAEQLLAIICVVGMPPVKIDDVITANTAEYRHWVEMANEMEDAIGVHRVKTQDYFAAANGTYI